MQQPGARDQWTATPLTGGGRGGTHTFFFWGLAPRYLSLMRSSSWGLMSSRRGGACRSAAPPPLSGSRLPPPTRLPAKISSRSCADGATAQYPGMPRRSGVAVARSVHPQNTLVDLLSGKNVSCALKNRNNIGRIIRPGLYQLMLYRFKFNIPVIHVIYCSGGKKT